ncbi:unnamed protein product [Spirodela intermedia]|uniref:Uncharacterized protein n=1 Tax=Spirodela intermedia TaxID=51605 RepID=A0A7I8JPC9_SPIIN|nr:unnamed protein product [Spirodela intermedia]CAA6671413.1 unnamed protein product [Spirodela intermedia]
MTLLETITRAAAGGGDVPTSAVSNFPVLLNGNEAFRNLTPEGGDSPGDSLVKRLVGWKIPETDVKSIEAVEKLVKKLRRKLKNRKSLGHEEFRGLLSSLPEKKLGDVVGGELVGLYAEGCVILGLWETLESMILSGLIGRLGPNDLVEKLVEQNRSDLLCLYVNHVSEIRASELLLILEYFLSPPRGSRECMLKVRKEWESQAILAVEKTTQKGLPDEVMNLAREASILLMMAHDGFSSSELCLHSLFSTPNLDGLVMSSAISRLGGSEVLGLVRYLRKWLDKYERFPEGCPCPEAGPALGLKLCELVPSLESVVRGLALVIDEHYPYLVLNSHFHDEMSSIRRVVDSLASAAGLCCSLGNIIENLRSM